MIGSSVRFKLVTYVCWIGAVLLCAALFPFFYQSQPGVLYNGPQLADFHIATGQTLTLTGDNLNPSKRYIADSGSRLIVRAPLISDKLAPAIEIVAAGGSEVDAQGTNVHVDAQPGSTVTARDGVAVDARGATLTLYGDVSSRAFAGTTVYNHGTGDAYVNAGAVAYTNGKGRTIAAQGSTVYAQSLPDCDACTQVIDEPGSTAYIFDGAEGFATNKGLATFYVLKGGEGHCNYKCTAYIYPGAEAKFGPLCIRHQMPESEDMPKFPVMPAEEPQPQMADPGSPGRF